MNKTSFLCIGNKGKENSLVYQEIPRKTRGEEFFVFFSPSDPAFEPVARKLFRHIISLSRLGHPSNFFSRVMDIFKDVANFHDPDGTFLSDSMILVMIKRERDVYLLRNSGVEAVHRDIDQSVETPLDAYPGLYRYDLDRNSGQVELFESKTEDFFTLQRFEMAPGRHTIVFVPSKDFVERHREALLNSVFFPSFEMKDDGIETGIDLTFPAMRWNIPTMYDKPVTGVRRRGMIRKWIPYSAGAVAAIVALIFIFKPFGGGADSPIEGDVLLTAEDGIVETSETEAAEYRGSEETIEVKSPVPTDVSDKVTVSMVDGWKKKFDAPVTSSPVLTGDQVIFGCRDGNLYSFSRDGSLLWKYTGKQGIGASPFVSEGRAVCADYEGNVFCLDAVSGSLIWNNGTGDKIVSSPVIGNDMVISGTTKGTLYAFSLKDGVRLWAKNIGTGIWATSTIGDDFVIAATTDGSLVKLSHSGKVLWRVQPGGEIYSTPLVLKEKDLVIFGTGDRFIYAYSLSAGNLMWRFSAGSDIRSAPVTNGSEIFVGSEDGNLFALTFAGTLVWKRDVGGAVRSRPLVVEDAVFVTTYGSRLKAFKSKDGEPVVEFRVESPVYSSPATDGRLIFFGSNQGYFHAARLKRGIS
ncbi:MAG: PQQ-binding-like beta-propeller repeat protein [Candidatus Krumholzibacteria bacterium]|nr:PQQ-binding-like beta-propeller repeat protein [Candidatus Krumholzibacteria bacterium]